MVSGPVLWYRACFPVRVCLSPYSFPVYTGLLLVGNLGSAIIIVSDNFARPDLFVI